MLIAVADEVDASAIVVGTARENPISGAILGSVVLKLVQRASRPLLIVPTGEASDGTPRRQFRGTVRLAVWRRCPGNGDSPGVKLTRRQ